MSAKRTSSKRPMGSSTTRALDGDGTNDIQSELLGIFELNAGQNPALALFSLLFGEGRRSHRTRTDAEERSLAKARARVAAAIGSERQADQLTTDDRASIDRILSKSQRIRLNAIARKLSQREDTAFRALLSYFELIAAVARGDPSAWGSAHRTWLSKQVELKGEFDCMARRQWGRIPKAEMPAGFSPRHYRGVRSSSRRELLVSEGGAFPVPGRPSVRTHRKTSRIRLANRMKHLLPAVRDAQRAKTQDAAGAALAKLSPEDRELYGEAARVLTDEPLGLEPNRILRCMVGLAIARVEGGEPPSEKTIQDLFYRTKKKAKSGQRVGRETPEKTTPS